MSKNIEIQSSCGNVFEDLGLPNSKEYLVKSKLVLTITEIINQRSLNQSQAAEILGITQPKVSALLNGKLYGFSIDKLMTFLTKLDRNIDIVIRKKDPTNEYGKISVGPSL